MIFQQYFILLQLHLPDDSQMLFLLMLQGKIQLLHLKDMQEDCGACPVVCVMATQFINCSLSGAVRVPSSDFCCAYHGRDGSSKQHYADGALHAYLECMS